MHFVNINIFSGNFQIGVIVQGFNRWEMQNIM